MAGHVEQNTPTDDPFSSFAYGVLAGSALIDRLLYRMAIPHDPVIERVRERIPLSRRLEGQEDGVIGVSGSTREILIAPGHHGEFGLWRM